MHDYDHTDECIVLVLGSSCTINVTSSCIIDIIEWNEAHAQRGTCLRNCGTKSLLEEMQGEGSMCVKVCICTRPYT